jgi:glycosyltransferase involved in cell wall biosynthesis
MNICVVTNPVGPTANAERSLLDVLSEITRVSLMTAGVSEDSEVREGYEVIDVSSRGGDGIVSRFLFFLLNQIRMCNSIRKRDEEVIWFFGATAYVVPVLFSKLLGRTIVVQPRGDIPLTLEIYWSENLPSPLAHFLADLVRLLERINYRLSDAIVTYTPSMAEQLGLGRYDEKLFSEGARYIRTDRFYPRIPYEERENIVGFLGRLDEEKRIRELAEVAKKLPGDVKFVFAGDGGLKQWLEEELSEEIPSGDAEMTGWVEHDEVPEVLSRFKLIILPSQPTEGLPTVILESFACGTPVYATPVSGVPDVVVEGETGFLISEIEPEELTGTVEEILNRDDLGRISSNCQRLVDEEYSFEASVDRYSRILEKIDQSR